MPKNVLCYATARAAEVCDVAARHGKGQRSQECILETYKTNRRLLTYTFLCVCVLFLMAEVPRLFRPDHLHAYRIGMVVLFGAGGAWTVWRLLTGRTL